MQLRLSFSSENAMKNLKTAPVEGSLTVINVSISERCS